MKVTVGVHEVQSFSCYSYLCWSINYPVLFDPRFIAASTTARCWLTRLCNFTDRTRHSCRTTRQKETLRGDDYEECRLLGSKMPVRTSQETCYISATEPSRLILCKTCNFHGGDYEECRLRYRKPVRTSQETHCVSATEPSRLMICKI
jgi:hypothetical protein